MGLDILRLQNKNTHPGYHLPVAAPITPTNAGGIPSTNANTALIKTASLAILVVLQANTR